MKKHNGMRPLDVVVLLKIISYNGIAWKIAMLAADLVISASEISEALNRSAIAGLLDETKKIVFKQNLLDFLQYGIKYVFPQRAGALAIGLATAHSAPIMSDKIISEEHYIWADIAGTLKGQTIEPLYVTVPMACKKDETLYAMLALVDVLRIGRPREIKIAIQELQQLFYPQKAA